MGHRGDKVGLKAVARRARKTPRYRAAVLRRAYRETGQMAKMPRKLAEAIQEDSKAPEGIGKTT